MRGKEAPTSFAGSTLEPCKRINHRFLAIIASATQDFRPVGIGGEFFLPRIRRQIILTGNLSKL